MNIVQRLREFADYCAVQAVEWDSAGDNARKAKEWSDRERLLTEAADEMVARDSATYKVVQQLVEAQALLQEQSDTLINQIIDSGTLNMLGRYPLVGPRSQRTGGVTVELEYTYRRTEDGDLERCGACKSKVPLHDFAHALCALCALCASSPVTQCRDPDAARVAQVVAFCANTILDAMGAFDQARETLEPGDGYVNQD